MMAIVFFSFYDTATTEIYTLSLHDALPIFTKKVVYENEEFNLLQHALNIEEGLERSEEHTSELQSRLHLVCRLLLEKKKPAHPFLNSAQPLVLVSPIAGSPLGQRLPSTVSC